MGDNWDGNRMFAFVVYEVPRRYMLLRSRDEQRFNAPMIAQTRERLEVCYREEAARLAVELGAQLEVACYERVPTPPIVTDQEQRALEAPST